MFGSYFKTLVRNLLKNKGYTFLNILGLAMGIACAGLIFLWVEDELDFDNYNVKKDRLYMVRVNQDYDTYIATYSSTPGPLAHALKSDFADVANTCRFTETPTTSLIGVDNRSMYATGRYAEPALFSMFTLPFEQGNANTPFSQLYSLVITHKAAVKFFGDPDKAMGRTIRMDNDHDYVVSGVLKDLPDNSTLQFEWLAPFDVWAKANTFVTSWTSFSMLTFVELRPQADASIINRNLKHYIKEKSGENKSTAHAFLFPMDKWNLYNDFDNGKQTGGGRIQYVRLFSAIAWIILLIACINFMNLATARSEQRSKEVGVRKVLGARKASLITQFVGESLLMAGLASAVAVVLMAALLPAFNALVEKKLLLHMSAPVHLAALIIITLFCGLVSASYPSLYLSSFNPVYVLKGIKLKAGSAALIRRALVVAQFSISIILIICTLIIYQQINHVKNRNLGLNKDNLIQMRAQGNLVSNFSAIKNDLIATGAVENAALADFEMLFSGNNTTSTRWAGKDPNASILVSQRMVSPEFLSVSRMQLAEGRNFEAADIQSVDELLADAPHPPTAVIVTQSLEKLMGAGSAVGKMAYLRKQNGTDINLKVVGVIKDFVYGDMYGKPDPVMFFCMPAVASYMYVRLKPSDDLEQSVVRIRKVMEKDNAGYPFEYTFTDDRFNSIFSSETLISRLSRVFAALAIIISCLGLFGLSAYMAERRTREISIRKVLGASTTGIVQLLTGDFLRLVCISCLVAFPVAWWIMHRWLQGYQYRIEIGAQVFIIAAVAAIAIAVVTVSFQSMKAAMANQMKSLRTE